MWVSACPADLGETGQVFLDHRLGLLSLRVWFCKELTSMFSQISQRKLYSPYHITLHFSSRL